MKFSLKTRFLTLFLLLMLLLSTAVGCFEGEAPAVTTEEGSNTSEPIVTTDASPDESTGTGETTTGSDGETSTDPKPPVDPDCFFVAHPELTVTYTKEQEAALFASLDRLTAAVTDESLAIDAFIELADQTEEDIYDLRTEYQLAYVESYLYKNDDAKRSTYLWLSEICNSAVQKFVALYAPIDDSKYGSDYYKDWDAEEKADAIAQSKTYDEECAALRTKIDALQQEQKTLSEAEYDQRSEEIYVELIKTGTALGKKLGYDGYMDYAYAEMYSREYTPEAVRQVAHLVGTDSYLAPVLDAALDRLYNAEITANEATLLQSILYGTFSDSTNKKLLDGFYKTLGGDIYEAYLAFFENGYYYLGHDENESEAGAFTFYLDAMKVPAMYFGPGYQTPFTFVHEFGHYYNYVKNGGEESLSYDLAETQSQGDEWLFLAYLRNIYKSTNVPSYLESYYVVNNLLTVFIAFSVNEFEMCAYDAVTSGNAAPAFDGMYKEAVNSIYSYDRLLGLLGYPPEDYWRLVVIENPGYYVSYAISQIPAMELYTVACEDFRNAVTIYEAVQTTGDFVEVIKQAGLHSPLESETYGILREALG